MARLASKCPGLPHTRHGRHTEYPDDLRITHSLHPDNAGLAPNFNASRTAPDVLNILKHPGPIPDHQGPAKDHPGPAKDEPWINSDYV